MTLYWYCCRFFVVEYQEMFTGNHNFLRLILDLHILRVEELGLEFVFV